MATQGLLSIVQDGKVLVKIVVGADGYNVHKLADTLRIVPTTDALKLLKLCRGHGLSGSSLVIQTSPTSFQLDYDDPNTDPDAELDKLYAEKFHDPRFNPRWESGFCAHTSLVELASPQEKSDTAALKVALVELLDAAHPAYVIDDYFRDKLIRARTKAQALL